MLHALLDYRWSGAGHVLPATIPGRLHQDLLAGGILGDAAKEPASARMRARRRTAKGLGNPAHGFQSRCGEWAALREWTLTSSAPVSRLEAERIFLCAQGVRGKGMVRVGGRDIAPFTEGDWEIEITAQAIDQMETTVELVFEAGLPEGKPPIVRIGVDGGLFLRGVNQLRVTDWRVTPRIVDGYGLIEAHTTVAPYVPGRYIFRYAAIYGDETLATEEITERLFAVEDTFDHRIVLPLPRWWRAGQDNELILLRLTVTRAGLVCDDKLLMTGFRDASFPEPETMKFTLEGENVFLAGAEWTGCRQSLLDPEEINRRLSLLRVAHINCLRVYGAETEALYDELDRRGFLFWQVLPLDVKEASALIRRIRHRPSLIAYGCDSVFAAPGRPADMLHPAVRALEATVLDLDETRPFFGPIPGGKTASPAKDELGTGVARDVIGPTEYEGPETLCDDMNRDDAIIRTIACPAPTLEIQELSGGEIFWPPTSPLWAHRAAQPFHLASLLSWFNPDQHDMESILPLARAVQAETVRYAVERARMRGHAAAGVFVRDPFERMPSLYSTALFDETIARPGFWALESALRPLHACARLSSMSCFCGGTFEAGICLLCDTLVMGLLTVKAQLLLPDGSVLAEASFDAKPETGDLGVLTAALPEYPCALVLRLTVDRFGEVMDINDYTICVSVHERMEALANSPKTAVYFTDGSLRNDGDYIALGVSGVAWAEAKFPGWGAVLPGEIRAVQQENSFEGLNLNKDWNVGAAENPA